MILSQDQLQEVGRPIKLILTWFIMYVKGASIHTIVFVTDPSLLWKVWDWGTPEKRGLLRMYEKKSRTIKRPLTFYLFALFYFLPMRGCLQNQSAYVTFFEGTLPFSLFTGDRNGFFVCPSTLSIANNWSSMVFTEHPKHPGQMTLMNLVGISKHLYHGVESHHI